MSAGMLFYTDDCHVFVVTAMALLLTDANLTHYSKLMLFLRPTRITQSSIHNNNNVRISRDLIYYRRPPSSSHIPPLYLFCTLLAITHDLESYPVSFREIMKLVTT